MSRNNFNKKGSSAANGFQKKNFKNRNNHFDDFESEQECDQLNGNNEIVIVKNNYEPVVNSEKEEVDSWMCENEVKLHGQEIPCPIFAFDQTTFPNMIQKLLFNNFEKPTPIQSISWPVALSGLDLVSIARTGSGKTLGFLLPAIVHIISQRSRNSQIGPIVVILLPTRELAQQVEGVAKEYCNSMRLNLVCCYGGAPKGPQLRAMRNGVDICVATPGRLNDFLNTGAVNMSGCSFLVMDEADRMLDMGFEPQIRTIVKRIRNDRQTLMFSATWPKEVRKLADEFQNNPVHLTVGSLELSANHNIKQNIEVFSDWHEKTDRLLSLLKEIMQKEQKKTIIFVATKRKADELAIKVRQSGHQALCIHGDKDQNERNWVLDQFKKGKTSILLATDVAARGIDISDIKFVVNYDFPNTTEDYVHRIGRTGRSDQLGTAYSFFTGSDRPKARDLIKVLEEAKQDVPEELAAMAPMGGFGRGNSGKWSGNNRKRNWNSGGNGQFGGQSKRTKFNDDGNWNKPNNAQRKNNWTANSGGGSRW